MEGHTVSSFLTNGGDGELQTAVYPLNLAPIAAKLRQRAFQTICNFRFFDAEKKTNREKNRICFFGFSSFSADFRGARLFLTSESSSSRFFALDGQIFRSVSPLGLIFRFLSPYVELRGQGTSNGYSWGAKLPRPPKGARHG